MKEREYFRHVCSIMISRNRRVNFAAVLDNHGKLLFGQSSTENCAACMRSPDASGHHHRPQMIHFASMKDLKVRHISSLITVLFLS
jgi:hypothetical protein